MGIFHTKKLRPSKVSAAVEQLSFQDLDLDAAELAGEVTWAPPTVPGWKIGEISGWKILLGEFSIGNTLW